MFLVAFGQGVCVGEDAAEGQLEGEGTLLAFEMRLVEPPPTLSSSARDNICSEQGW